jgi:hypothetical protein
MVQSIKAVLRIKYGKPSKFPPWTKPFLAGVDKLDDLEREEKDGFRGAPREEHRKKRDKYLEEAEEEFWNVSMGSRRVDGFTERTPIRRLNFPTPRKPYPTSGSPASTLDGRNGRTPWTSPRVPFDWIRFSSRQ